MLFLSVKQCAHCIVSPSIFCLAMADASVHETCDFGIPRKAKAAVAADTATVPSANYEATDAPSTPRNETAVTESTIESTWQVVYDDSEAAVAAEDDVSLGKDAVVLELKTAFEGWRKRIQEVKESNCFLQTVVTNFVEQEASPAEMHAELDRLVAENPRLDDFLKTCGIDVPHPKNRGGEAVKSSRTKQINDMIIKAGFDEHEANHKGSMLAAAAKDDGGGSGSN